MKRTTPQIIEWHRLRARNERRREFRYRSLKAPVFAPPEPAIERVQKPIVGPHSPKISQKRGARRALFNFIELPAVFSLRQNYDEVVGFFSRFRDLAYNARAFTNQRFGVEFATLKVVSPGAALMLAAELYRLQRFIGKRLTAVRQDEWDPNVRITLQELGLFKLLATPNVPRHIGTASSTGVQILEYSVDAEVNGNKCADLLDCLTEIAGEIPAQNFIYDGLVEALKNTKHHAYSDTARWFGVPAGTWFMTGSYDRNAKQLTAAVFDLGVGIPATLPRSGIWEHVRPFLSLGMKSDDGNMIAAAMEYGRTRTALKERGKGLPIMMRLLDHHQGYLRILSGKGEAIYDSLTKTMKVTNHAESVGGTLIEWSISSDQRSQKND